MTVGEWLAQRHPPAPAALRLRVEEALGPALARDARDGTALLLEAGERLAARLLADDSTTRESALDLLAADALVTYAFEAASESPGALGAQAMDAMRRIAALGAAAPAVEAR